MKKLLFASCLAVAGLFAFTNSEALADDWHHGHRHHGHHYAGHHGHHHHHGHVHHGGHWHHGGYGHHGGYSPYYYAPRVVYRPYPVYQTYGYYPYSSSSLFIGGRNFSFGISGF